MMVPRLLPILLHWYFYLFILFTFGLWGNSFRRYSWKWPSPHCFISDSTHSWSYNWLEIADSSLGFISISLPPTFLQILRLMMILLNRSVLHWLGFLKYLFHKLWARAILPTTVDSMYIVKRLLNIGKETPGNFDESLLLQKAKTN